MVVVAVAGGLGDLGQQIVKAIQDTQKYDVIVLTRKGRKANSLPGFDVIEVDYNSIDSLKETLDERKVHTIVSALGVHWKEASDNQISLIHAAEASSSVKRFLPAEFNIDYALSDEVFAMPGQEFFLENRAVLAETNLEYTLVYTGMFLDYFGMPNPTTPMRGLYHVIEVPKFKAAISGDGTTKVAYTLTSDIALFVAAMLGLEKWDGVYNIIGDLISQSEVVHATEKVIGRKFDITHDPMKMLREGRMTVLPGNELLYQAWPDTRDELVRLAASLGVAMILGAYDISGVGTSLNELFPDIKAMKVEEYLNRCFKSGA